MPSPRAVLADIHDLNLDPGVAHTGIKASGHLRTSAVVEPVAELKVAESKAVLKPEPVSLPEPVKDVEVEATPDAPTELPATETAEVPKKKGSPFKKKDKPEEPPVTGS